VFQNLKSGLAAPLSGMGTAFSASLLGLSGSLILGFLDLQASQAQNAFYTDLEDWMTSMTELDHPMTQMQATGLGLPGEEMSAMLDRLGSQIGNADSSQNAIRAVAELARGIDGLVKHIRAEQADLRIHIEEQGDTNKKLRELIEAMLREDQSSNGGRPN
jgi:predicted ATPase